MAVEWTDGNLQCCIEKESETSFYYGEVRAWGEDAYIVCAASIDLQDYKKEEIEDVVKTYYPCGIEEVKNTYGNKANQIMAECIFESISEMDIGYIGEPYPNKDTAAKALESYAMEINTRDSQELELDEHWFYFDE